jgi:PTS system mannose-specific IIA component
VGLVLTSHGLLAGGVRDAAEMIIGPQDGLAVVAMGPAEDLDAFRAKLEEAVHAVDRGRGVLVLADLFGGSPGNTAAYVLGPTVEVVTGVNLPMLLEVLINRVDAETPAGLAAIACTAARDGVMRLADMLGG